MSEAAKSLDEVFERTGVAARLQERNSLAIAKNMVNLGYSFESVVSATMLDPEKVKGLYEETGLK